MLRLPRRRRREDCGFRQRNGDIDRERYRELKTETRSSHIKLGDDGGEGSEVGFIIGKKRQGLLEDVEKRSTKSFCHIPSAILFLVKIN
ncbi:hypothetical protein WN55_11362 [Dufourea novaeangliae]|uniref:Uncharacterized protein n=1 Tax=Dufourea novaeangliae TaxID=178035 RepID=A0A154PAC9_DUFNO|nr:hypothetical protein WN55_11362 [Dufourea novaeangliae]